MQVITTMFFLLRVLNFMLPACGTNFAEVPPPYTMLSGPHLWVCDATRSVDGYLQLDAAAASIFWNSILKKEAYRFLRDVKADLTPHTTSQSRRQQILYRMKYVNCVTKYEHLHLCHATQYLRYRQQCRRRFASTGW
jgi:hypothetical protein